MKNIIEMKEIYHSYKEKEVLKGISLTVKKGEIIGLLGPSGVGKTTVKKYFHDLITGILYSLLNLFIPSMITVLCFTTCFSFLLFTFTEELPPQQPPSPLKSVSMFPFALKGYHLRHNFLFTLPFGYDVFSHHFTFSSFARLLPDTFFQQFLHSYPNPARHPVSS